MTTEKLLLALQRLINASALEFGDALVALREAAAEYEAAQDPEGPLGTGDQD